MVEMIFIICMTLLALRCFSSMDKQKDLKILRLKNQLKRMGGNNNEQRVNNKQQTGKQIYDGNRI